MWMVFVLDPDAQRIGEADRAFISEEPPNSPSESEQHHPNGHSRGFLGGVVRRFS